MIKELNLNNWKSFSNAKLYIDPMTFIIGTNASGKSNVLDALSFLHFISMGMPIETVLKEHIRGGAEWAVRKGCNSFSLTIIDEQNGYDYEYQVVCGFSENNVFELESERLERRGKRKLPAKTIFVTDKDSDYIASTIPVRFYTAKEANRRGWT